MSGGLIRVERSPSGEFFVAHGPDSLRWLLKRTTEEAARVDGAEYLRRHYAVGPDGKWVPR